jgi:cytoskeletal protein CcmA (bactofilin family)
LNVTSEVTLGDKSKVIGDINAPVMDIARGAMIVGQVQMGTAV